MTVTCCCIVGTTGVGKSQLAVDLALACNGEVINADSMQVYQGLDVLTNKCTAEEMRGVPHRLLSFVPPSREYFVGDFVPAAQDEIGACVSAGHLPIIAGGTAYYVQNLLFQGGLTTSEKDGKLENDPLYHLLRNALLSERLVQLSADHQALLGSIRTLPNTPSPSVLPADFPYERVPPSMRSPDAIAAAFYHILQILDPDMAARWHARDIRKVRRNIEICLEQGKPASEVVATQEGPRARYRTLVIWLYADQEGLEKRLNERVDTMLGNGLLEEVRALCRLSDESGRCSDVTSGIFQAIGYREFLGYLTPPCLCCPLSSHPRLDTEEARYAHAVERTKLSTRQYARKQDQWLRKRLLPAALASEATDVIALDASTPELWESAVRAPAEQALRRWLAGETISFRSEGLLADMSMDRHTSEKEFISCTTCAVRLAPSQMADHLASKAHRARSRPRQG